MAAKKGKIKIKGKGKNAYVVVTAPSTHTFHNPGTIICPDCGNTVSFCNYCGMCGVQLK